MTTKFKINLTIFIISILVPYFLVIVFIRTAGAFSLLPFFLLTFITLIIVTIRIRKIEPNQTRRKFYWPIAIVAIFTFFLSYGFL